MSTGPRADRHRLVTELFLAAVDRSPAERSAWLAERCGADLELRDEVQALLDADAATSGVASTAPTLPSASLREIAGRLSDARPSSSADAQLDGMPFDHPRRIGAYEIREPIAAGRLGAVFRARRDGDARDVALKVLCAALATRRDVRRFEREARILRHLRHPGIVGALDAGVARCGEMDWHYLAMECVEGETLRSALARGALRWPAARGLFLEICAALEHAHALGVVHRDLKPSNVIVDRDGHARVLDFGAASWSASEGLDLTRHTNAGEIVGTLAYMSPEQAGGRAREADERSDVFSLGVLLSELASGRPPFDGDGDGAAPHELLRRVREGAPRLSRRAWRSLPPALRALVRRAQATDPEQRFASVAELRHAVEELETVRSPSTFRASARIAAGAVLALALVAVLARTSSPRRADAAPSSPGTEFVALARRTTPPHPRFTRGEPSVARGWARKGGDDGATNHSARPWPATDRMPALRWRRPDLTDASVLLVDLDGDGAEEVATFHGGRWLEILDGAGWTRWRVECPHALDYARDLDGDGRGELVVSRHADGSAPSATILCDGGFELDRLIFHGANRSTHLSVVGHEGLDLLAAVYSSFDKLPRAVARLVYTTHTEQQHYLTAGGGSNCGQIALGDLDLDGVREIVTSWVTPDNNTLVNGTNDGELFVVAVDTASRVKIQRRFDYESGDGARGRGVLSPMISDLDHEGPPELFVAEWHDPIGRGTAGVQRLDARGNTLARWRGPSDESLRMTCVRDTDGDGVDELVVSSVRRELTLQVLDGRTLAELRGVPDAGIVMASADLDGDGIDEVITNVPRRGLLRIYDARSLAVKMEAEVGACRWEAFEPCSLWAIGDVDGAGRPTLLVSTARGLFAFGDE